jgi:hypothetical protein
MVGKVLFVLFIKNIYDNIIGNYRFRKILERTGATALLVDKRLSYKNLTNSSFYAAEKHGFHLVRPSPWPLLTSICIFQLVLSILAIFNEVGSLFTFLSNFYLLSACDLEMLLLREHFKVFTLQMFNVVYV